MKRFLRRVLRLLTITAAVLLLLFGLAAYTITQPTADLVTPATGPQANPGLLRRHVEFLTTEASPRDSDHPENLDKAADYIRARFEETGARVRDQEFEVRGRVYRNVIASFGPATGPLLVVGAHYDSFGDFGVNPGADDNASGTAGLLELARLLAGSRLSQRVELVAYANEEPPYFGSPWMGSAGRWSDRALTRHLKKSIRASGFPAHSFTAPRSAGLDGSDQINYWDLGIPAVMVTDTSFVRNPNYHTPRDTAETLDYQRMAGVVEGLGAGIKNVVEVVE